MTLLTVSKISKREGNFALDNISFTQRASQKIAIAGETGSGKSTLLKIIAGLLQPDKGEVIFEDTRIPGPDEKLVPGHPRIAYLSQQFELPKFLRVEQVLAYASELTDEAASNLYTVCQLKHLLKRRTDQLSGGEKQRIAICKLLIASPCLLLLDEPFSHLDMVHKNTLKSVISDILKKLKITCILVSHDPHDTLSWADQLLVMKDGQIVQKGSPVKIYARPVTEYVGGLFGNYNLIHPLQARPLLKLWGLKSRKKNLFVRPENLKLVKKGRNTIKGMVQHVKFFGSYYEVDVLVLDIILTVKTAHDVTVAGDIVYVTLSQSKAWYV